MAGPALDLKPPFNSVLEFVTWLKNSNPLRANWNGLNASRTSDGDRFSHSLFKVSSRKAASPRKDLPPVFSTKVKPNVTFSERQRSRKRGAVLSEGPRQDSPVFGVESFSGSQKIRKIGELGELTCAELLYDSMDHLFPGSTPEYDPSTPDLSNFSSMTSSKDKPHPEFLPNSVDECTHLALDESVREKQTNFERCSSSDEYESSGENHPDAAGRKGFRFQIKIGSNGRRLLSGAIAGAFSRTAVAPLETIRTHMMVGRHGKSIKGVMEWILENEGWTGLFRGNTINVIRVAPSKAIELFVFDKLKVALTPKEGEAGLKIPASSIAGSAAGISSTVLMYPLELLKTRLTIQPEEYRSFSHALWRIVREEGFAELYRGLGPSVVGIVPYAGTNYFAYDYLRSLYKRCFETDHIGNFQTLLIGSLAGAIASSATFPLEVARKRMQVGALKGRPLYRNTLDCLVSVFREEGLAGLYRGLGPSCLKLVPAAGLSFMCYEALKNILLEEEEKKEKEKKKKKEMAE